MSITTNQTHPCVTTGCTNTVAFDDEPWCFTCSPDSGSNVRGYSYKAEHSTESDIGKTVMMAVPTEPAPLPEVIVEYKRYDADLKTGSPDGWVFYTLTPDEYGSETPFSKEPVGVIATMTDAEVGAWYEEQQKSAYRGTVHGWMQLDSADEWSAEHIHNHGYVIVPWDEVPEGFRYYVVNCVLPLEWQNDVDFCAERTTIHLKGVWPA